MFLAMTAGASPAYASFGRRFRALVIDGAILAGALVLIVLVGDATRHVPGSGRVFVVLIYALILYEPIMVWRYGATLGHRATNLRVVDDASGGKPGFLKALARFVIKTVLGLVSFMTMAITRRYQAVHDAITHTTVQIRDLDLAGPDDYYVARSDPDGFIMPSRVRRVVVILLYMIVILVAIVLVDADVIPRECWARKLCTETNRLTEQMIGSLWVWLNVFAIILGWRGKLPGCRRHHS